MRGDLSDAEWAVIGFLLLPERGRLPMARYA